MGTCRHSCHVDILSTVNHNTRTVRYQDQYNQISFYPIPFDKNDNFKHSNHHHHVTFGQETGNGTPAIYWDIQMSY
jgi:hypothetical protein